MPDPSSIPADLMAVELDDGRTVAIDEVLDGRVFTHRLTEPEIAADLLATASDLGLVIMIVAQGTSEMTILLPVEDDDEFARRGADPAGFGRVPIALPTGALRGRSVGELVGIAVRDRECRLVDVESAVPPEDLGARIDALVGGSVADPDAVVLTLLADDPVLCVEPLPPLSELFADNGFEVDSGSIARAGFDFGSHFLRTAVETIAEEYGLDTDEAAAVQGFRVLVDVLPDLGDDALDPAALQFAAIGSPAAAEALWSLLAPSEDPATVRRAALLLTTGPRAAHAAGHWLAGRAADLLGMLTEAESHYEDALFAEPGYPPALFDLAFLAADRSDVVRAQMLAERALGGPPDDDREADPLVAALAPMLPRPHPELGRNDRCWCGSGRKYKVCHLGRSAASSTERAEFLYVRIELFAVHFSADLLVHNGFPVDLVMFEGHCLDEYLRRRGAVLTAEDTALITAWQRVARTVYEVLAADPERATLRDLSTGTEQSVRNGDLEPVVGELITARALPVDGERYLFDWYGITPDEADDLLGSLAQDDHDGVFDLLMELHLES